MELQLRYSTQIDDCACCFCGCKYFYPFVCNGPGAWLCRDCRAIFKDTDGFVVIEFPAQKCVEDEAIKRALQKPDVRLFG